MSKARKPNPEGPDRDNPEWTAEDMEKARPAADVLADQLGERSWEALLSYGQERARTLGLTADDVPRLIQEYRRSRVGLGEDMPS